MLWPDPLNASEIAISRSMGRPLAPKEANNPLPFWQIGDWFRCRTSKVFHPMRAFRVIAASQSRGR